MILVLSHYYFVLQEKFMEQHQKCLAKTGQEQLTIDDEDIIFHSVMDPATRNRRYGFGNQVVNVFFPLFNF